MVEEGGKALAAYLKPREEGEVKTELADEIADVVKTLGQVAEYWLSDPQRAVEVQTEPRQGLSRSVGRAPSKRLAGETIEPVAAPDAERQALRRSEWSSNQFFDFLKQAYLLTSRLGRATWSRTPTGSTRTRGTRPSSTSSRSPTRSRRRTSC